MITDNTAKWRVGSISTPQVNSGDGLLPVGHIYYTMGSSAPAGSLPLSGQVFSRSTYKDLWEWVNLHPEQLLSESAWQTKYIENNGLVPFYSEGTDSTNFRVPNCTMLGLQDMDYVVDEWQQGQEWYRVWKSGWIEQGGGFEVKNDYVTQTFTFRKPFKGDTYYASATGSYTGSTANSEVISAKTSTTITFSGVHNTDGRANWIAKGYGERPIVDEKVLWCVKAFGNIDENSGSTTLTNIANNITQLNTKVDNWVSGTLDSHATAIAKMQSYFNGNFEKTLLFGSESTWSNANEIILSDSWRNYDGLMFFAGDDSNAYRYFDKAPILWKWWFEEQIRLAKINPSSQGRYPRLWINGSMYLQWDALGTFPSDISLKTSVENCGIFAVYGIKLKATGITNKSAIDVSQISDKISSLLTTDNHLKLPSGLEVW